MQYLRRIFKIRRTTVLSVALIAFLGGLGFARVSEKIDSSIVVLLIVLFLSSIVIYKRNKVPAAVILIILGFTLGWWRGAVYIQKLSVYDDIVRKNVVVIGQAEDDSIYSERGQLLFSISNVKLIEPHAQDLAGTIEIEGYGTPMVYRGDIIKAEGRMFKKRGAQQAGISFASISTEVKNNSVIETIRRKFATGMQTALPEPMASFALGLLIGQRSTIPLDVNQHLIDVGLIHIVAVSGYNLTVIISISRRLLNKRSRFQSLSLSLLLIGLFLLFTGYSPSIVRAALVSSLGLFMWYFGRQLRPVLLLLIVAALTAGIYPLYLWSNIGWYLSFTAFFGILIVAPLILRRIRNKNISEKLLVIILVETLAAQVCTLPIILFIFARLSLISIVANILVVPLVPFAMLLSLIAGISGMINMFLLGLFSLPARIILEYMLSISALLSEIPHANVVIKVSLMQMIYMYALILTLTCILWLRSKSIVKQKT